MKKQMRKINFTYGFTLIELLVVVLIIGVLAAIALPQYHKSVAKSKFHTLLPIIKSLKDAQERYYYLHGTYTPDFNLLDISVPNQSQAVTSSQNDFTHIDFDNGTWIAINLSSELNQAIIGGMGAAGGRGITAARKNEYRLFLDKATSEYRIICYEYSAASEGEKICKNLGGTLITQSANWTTYHI